MTAAHLRKARETLGSTWKLGRPLAAAELGRILGLQGRDPGRSVLDWEAGKFPISGPVSRAIEAWLGGYEPAGRSEALRLSKNRSQDQTP